jgi:hypothetical protein
MVEVLSSEEGLKIAVAEPESRTIKVLDVGEAG